MRPDRRLARPPREIEQEVEAEGREWMRRRLQEKLQAEADRCGEVSPPQRAEAGGCNILMFGPPSSGEPETSDFRYQLNLIATPSPKAVEVGTPSSAFPNARFQAQVW
jgi:hypothetical protein